MYDTNLSNYMLTCFKTVSALPVGKEMNNTKKLESCWLHPVEPRLSVSEIRINLMTFLPYYSEFHQVKLCEVPRTSCTFVRWNPL